jgi:rhodanese-related sulfurtransferase
MTDNTVPRVTAGEIDINTMPVIDVRRHAGKEQIRGAVRYDSKALLRVEPLALPFAHDERIVVYGDDENEAAQVAARLRQHGFTDVSLLDGGFQAYRAAGLPTEELTQEQPIPGSESGIPRV